MLFGIATGIFLQRRVNWAGLGLGNAYYAGPKKLFGDRLVEADNNCNDNCSEDAY